LPNRLRWQLVVQEYCGAQSKPPSLYLKQQRTRKNKIPISLAKKLAHKAEVGCAKEHVKHGGAQSCVKAANGRQTSQESHGQAYGDEGRELLIFQDKMLDIL
jgi:hypothetical protein